MVNSVNSIDIALPTLRMFLFSNIMIWDATILRSWGVRKKLPQQELLPTVSARASGAAFKGLESKWLV